MQIAILPKPIDVNDFLKVSASIKDFWISIVQLKTDESISQSRKC